MKKCAMLFTQHTTRLKTRQRQLCVEVMLCNSNLWIICFLLDHIGHTLP